MANQEQVGRLKKSVQEWNSWKRNNPTIRSDLSSADLSYANLAGADLAGANLSYANLSDAYLAGADLNRANLSSAHLNRANLNGANLNGANLSSADLRDADFRDAELNSINLNNAVLIRANLNRAKLRGAIFKETRIGLTSFGAIDLRTVQGLETVIHRYPSTIGTDTILRSEGDIPDMFLRGAGLSDTFIEYARSLAQHPIKYYTCFISYSSQDEDFAKRLYADLQSNNVRCWFAPEHMDIGDKIRHRIEESIRLYITSCC